MIGQIISHYKILEKLGEGGMGIVYKAHDTKLDRLVALKFLPPHLTKSDTDKARFLQEARAAAALNYTNVCVIYEIEDQGDFPFISMEYIDGITLREKFRDKPLSLNNVIDNAIQIAEALKSAHKKGVTHRDIKSENIMVTETGQVKVMDFGLAKIRGSVKLTKTSSTIGTIAYMSPENLQGKEVDARTDIFSFGVVLYEMLTGQLPFKGEYDSAVMYSIINEEPEPIQKYRSNLSSEVLHLLDRALEKDPEDRYQTVKDMLIDLKRLKRDTDKLSRKTLIKVEPEESVPTVEVYENEAPVLFSVRKKRINKIPLLIAAVTAIALVISAVFIIQKQRSKFIENRVVVVPFENNTGDESLDMLGRMAAEMITQGMSQIGELEAVPFISVMDSYSNKEEKPSAFTIAAQNEAGVLITGSYYMQSEDLFFRASIMDAEHETLLAAPSPIIGLSMEQEVVLERLCDQVLGALIIHFRLDVPTAHINIPSFEAYKEFLIGRELFSIDYDGARSHFYSSLEIDSAFTLPLLYIAVSYSNQHRYAKADSLYEIINQQRDKLARFDRALLDWGIAGNTSNRPQAMRFLRQAEVLAPNNNIIQYIIGLNAREQNLPRLTVDTYEELGYVRMAEYSVGDWGFQVWAHAHYMLGEYKEGLDVIHFSRQHFPDKSDNLRYEVILQAALGQIQEVNRVVNESFQLSGSAPGDVMIDAALALRAHGHKDAAHEVLTRALEWYYSRVTGDHRFAIGKVLYYDDQWAEAQKVFEQLYREYPDNQSYRGYTGFVAARLGDREKANRILEELYSKDEPYLFGSHLYMCACIAAILGEHQRAVDLLREAYGQGRAYGMWDLLDMDFESLRNYQPYIELMRPKG